MALRDMIRLVYAYQSMRPGRSARSHLGNQVSASRAPEDLFTSCSPLGLSLDRLRSIKVCRPTSETELNVVYRGVVEFQNSRGLPEVFNAAIEARLAAGSLLRGEQTRDEILVFVHDDVWLDDAQTGEHLLSGFGQFDVIGVAGSVGRVAGQLSWFAFNSGSEILDHAMSGMICHGNDPCGEISYFGPWKQSCELLDGVFLAVRLNTIANTGLRFDPRFDFHFYDVDFCRTARSLGLRLGTWPIALTHQSGGSFDDEWRSSHAEYLAKWGD